MKQATKQTHRCNIHYLFVLSFLEVLVVLSDLEVLLLQRVQGSRCCPGSQEVLEVLVFQVNPSHRSLASASLQPAGPAVLLGKSRTMDHNMHKLTQKQLSWAVSRDCLQQTRARAQEETVQQRGKNLITSPLESRHTFPLKLCKFGRRKIILFISSNQQQKNYVHGVKDLMLFSHGSSLHGVLN